MLSETKQNLAADVIQFMEAHMSIKASHSTITAIVNSTSDEIETMVGFKTLRNIIRKRTEYLIETGEMYSEEAISSQNIIAQIEQGMLGFEEMLIVLDFTFNLNYDRCEEILTFANPSVTINMPASHHKCYEI